MPFTTEIAQGRRPSVTLFLVSRWWPNAQNVPSEILIPSNTWSDKSAYEATAKKLAGLFNKNFANYLDGVSAEVKTAGPVA